MGTRPAEEGAGERSGREPLHPVPGRAVLAVVGAVALVLLAVAPRYGWHRDELYFLEAGRHLAWGYVDQPPFTPFVARVADIVASGNLVVLRLLPALATTVSVAMGALLVREMGGARRAQVLGTAAVASGGFLLGAGHLLATAVFDLAAWMVLLWLAARLLRTEDPRWWLAFGAVAGLAMLNKNLVPLLAVSLGVGLLVERRWALLWSPWLPLGGAVALVLAAPNLWWQATNGWPQLDMAEVLAERLAAENRATLLPLQVLFAGPALVGFLWAGARRLAADPEARRFRVVLWAWPAGLVGVFATGGRPYYVVPLTVVVLLAGLVAVDDAASVRRAARLVAVNGAASALLALPLLPLAAVPVTAAVNEAVAETVGWPELADQVAAVVADVTEGDPASVVLLAASYGEAGALDRFGPARGLPPAHSPHNGYADFRQPADEGATVVAVRFPAERLAPWFDDCTEVATVDNGLDIDNEVQGAPIVVCRGLTVGWDELWEELRFLS